MSLLKCFIILVFLSPISTFGGKKTITDKKPNIVFIFVDDLRPDLGSYGNSVVHSPHLDQFAGEAVLFNRQYATVPTCGASRLSLLTGKLPRSTFELRNEAAELLTENKGLKPQTFIEELRDSGYYTVGIGKVSHSADGYVYPYTGPKSSKEELPHAWDELLFDAGKWENGWNAFFAYEHGKSRITEHGNVAPFEVGVSDNETYPDELTAALAVNKIKDLSAEGKPFFMGVGFFKPHLPFNAPKRFWDLYDVNDISLSETLNAPIDVSTLSLHNSGELNQYKQLEHPVSLQTPFSSAYSKKLIHGYYASISYVDEQIGKVIRALKEEGIYDNTIIVVWGDHGWHLGDYGLWGKHTLFDKSLRSVLIIKPQHLVKTQTLDQVVSAVDIVPTIMELAGIQSSMSLDGRSMKELMLSSTSNKWQNRAYSYFNNGISVVTDRYRFNKYFKNRKSEVELFDHQQDPHETINVAKQYPEVVRALEKYIADGNTGLYD